MHTNSIEKKKKENVINHFYSLGIWKFDLWEEKKFFILNKQRTAD
jgi:hypothetical protein